MINWKLKKTHFKNVYLIIITHCVYTLTNCMYKYKFVCYIYMHINFLYMEISSLNYSKKYMSLYIFLINSFMTEGPTI